MTIELTDSQINEIFEGFDWYTYVTEYINQDFLDQFLNNNVDMLIDYLDYGRNYDSDRAIEKWIKEHNGSN